MSSIFPPISNVIPPISNVDCLCKMEKESTPPPASTKILPGVKSAISCLKPGSGNIQYMPYRFSVLPPISQIDILSSRSNSSNEFDERNNVESRISNVACLNADGLEKDAVFSSELPSGRMAKKDYGIKPYDSEFIKLCKMNGRTDLLKDTQILERKTNGLNMSNFEKTRRRTILRSANKSWKPSEWVKFGVYEAGQLR